MLLANNESSSFEETNNNNNNNNNKRRGSCPRMEEAFGRLGPIREISFRSLDSDLLSKADSCTTKSGGHMSSSVGTMSCYSSSQSTSSHHRMKQSTLHENVQACTPERLSSRTICEEVPTQCTDCGRKSSRTSRLTGKSRGKCENPHCDAFLCRSCKRKWVLLQLPSSSVQNTKERDWRTATFKRYCQHCYMKFSTIDFSCHSEVIEPSRQSQCSRTTIIFTHREGWSRASFRPHAKYLAENYGHRCILVDYAGHGSRWQEKCTPENCVQAVAEVLKAYKIPTAKIAEAMGTKTIFAASSWGGLMAFHVLDKFQDYFSGVIFDSCCINVSSLVERLQRASFSFLLKRLNHYNRIRLQRTLLAMKGESYVEFFESNFAAGIFTKSGISMKRKTKFKDLTDVIAQVQCPMLFFNGTKGRGGYDDKAVNKIMHLLKHKEESKVALFDGGDHLISHDLRFFSSWVDTAARFIYHSSIESS